MAEVLGGWDVANEAPAADPWAPVAEHPIAGPTGDVTTDVPRFLGTAAANALGGLLSFPHLPAQGIDWLGRRVGVDIGADPALSAIRDPSSTDNRPLVPDFQTARNMAFVTTGGTEYQPQTYLGRRAMDATTAGLLSVANPSAIPAAMGVGAAGGAAAEIFPEHPFLAALGGGLFGGVAANTLLNTGQRFGAALLNTNPSEPYAAFQRQGLPTRLAGTTTGDPGMQWAEKWAARMPGSEGPMADARGELLNAWQDRLGQVADTLGSASTPAEAGRALQSDATNWLTNFKTGTRQLWDNFHQQVPGTTPTPVSNYQQALTDVLGNFRGAPETGKAVQPATLRTLSDALGVDLQGGNSLPWEAVKSLRTAIGEKLENPSTVADTSQAALRRIYGALTQDMETGAANVSPQALSSFYRANSATAAGHDLLENYLDPILKASSPEDATQYAMAQARRGGTRLGALTFNLPSAAGELGSYALRNAATNTESPTSFQTAMGGRRPLYSQEAQDVLFPNPRTQADIADMTATGRAMMPAEKDLANSPTATHQTRGLPGRLIAASELGRTGGEFAGTPGRIAGFAAGLIAPEVGARAAQFVGLNPLLSRFYGRNIPIDLTPPGMINRMMIGGAVDQQ